MSERHGDEEEEFLTRWSRRKVESRRADPEGKSVPPPEPVSDVANTVAPPESAATGPALPPIEELNGLQSEYRDFLRPGVDETLRRTALSKLFQDPHFNVMDGLDTYIDDYTRADPISEDALKTLNQARGLIFDHDDKPGEAPGAETSPARDSKQATPRASQPLPSASDARKTEAAADDGAPPIHSEPGAPV